MEYALMLRYYCDLGRLGNRFRILPKRRNSDQVALCIEVLTIYSYAQFS
jgi:hypothetical protein